MLIRTNFKSKTCKSNSSSHSLIRSFVGITLVNAACKFLISVSSPLFCANPSLISVFRAAISSSNFFFPFLYAANIRRSIIHNKTPNLLFQQCLLFTKLRTIILCSWILQFDSLTKLTSSSGRFPYSKSSTGILGLAFFDSNNCLLLSITFSSSCKEALNVSTSMKSAFCCKIKFS